MKKGNLAHEGLRICVVIMEISMEVPKEVNKMAIYPSNLSSWHMPKESKITTV
jgi:hypothetical protein